MNALVMWRTDSGVQEGHTWRCRACGRVLSAAPELNGYLPPVCGCPFVRRLAPKMQYMEDITAAEHLERAARLRGTGRRELMIVIEEAP